MKKLLFSVAAMAVLFTACKKEENGAKPDSFVIGGVTYEVSNTNVMSAAGSHTFTAAAVKDGAAGTISFISFKPLETGDYTVVSAGDLTSDANSDKKVITVNGIANNVAYSSSSNDQQVVKVTVSGENYKFTASDIELIELNGTNKTQASFDVNIKNN